MAEDRMYLLENEPEHIDMATFVQILEMDDPGEVEFSMSIVLGFFEQADDTFTQMDESLEEKELQKLSNLGHFLKGSSATLGLIRVRESCQQIERYGKRELNDDEELSDDEILERIKGIVEELKAEMEFVQEKFDKFYEREENA